MSESERQPGVDDDGEQGYDPAQDPDTDPPMTEGDGPAGDGEEEDGGQEGGG